MWASIYVLRDCYGKGWVVVVSFWVLLERRAFGQPASSSDSRRVRSWLKYTLLTSESCEAMMMSLDDEITSLWQSLLLHLYLCSYFLLIFVPMESNFCFTGASAFWKYSASHFATCIIMFWNVSVYWFVEALVQLFGDRKHYLFIHLSQFCTKWGTSFPRERLSYNSRR